MLSGRQRNAVVELIPAGLTAFHCSISTTRRIIKCMGVGGGGGGGGVCVCVCVCVCGGGGGGGGGGG